MAKKKKSTKVKPSKMFKKVSKAKPSKKSVVVTKTTKAKPSASKGEIEVVTLDSSIIKKTITYFSHAKIEKFVIKTLDEVLWFTGIDIGFTSFCLFKIEGIAENDASLVIDMDKLKKVMKTSKKEVSIFYDEAKQIVRISTGRINHKIAVEPIDDYKDIIDYVDSAGNIDMENYYKCTVDPDLFADVISVGSELDFSEAMYFEPQGDMLYVSLLEQTKVDESTIDVVVTDSETVGEEVKTIIHPKYIETFKFFDDDFELVIPEEAPIIASQVGTIGKDEHKFKILVMIAPKKGEATEEDTLEGEEFADEDAEYEEEDESVEMDEEEPTEDDEDEDEDEEDEEDENEDE